MSSVNKAILVGNMGADIEAKPMSNGGMMGKFGFATSKKVKGEDKTTWHNVVVWDDKKVEYLQKYAKTGTKLYIEGEIETRSYEQDGTKKYITEIVVGRFDSRIQILGNGRGNDEVVKPAGPGADAKPSYGIDDEVPF